MSEISNTRCNITPRVSANAITINALMFPYMVMICERWVISRGAGGHAAPVGERRSSHCPQLPATTRSPAAIATNTLRFEHVTFRLYGDITTDSDMTPYVCFFDQYLVSVSVWLTVVLDTFWTGDISNRLNVSLNYVLLILLIGIAFPYTDK